MPDSQALVLVVDDNEMNRDMLSRRLQRQKFAVEVAENGEQALKMIQDKDYDLVLLDIMMPNISGYEVLERIKSDPETKGLPVIMISAVDDLDSVVRCIELGAEDYLFKPFNPVLLKARVNASLRRDRSSGPDLNGLKSHVSTMQAAVGDLLASNPDESQKAHIERLQDSLSHIESILVST